ncbi:hypothetical protein NOK12_28840 [Nocardioides sp. OK12]|uniref:hypothetical protein n=1 Tax=Nocardioides sp. OK12 TaxID=2758661 RepID=UPI0021C46C97|nr:hypothetical protein [Nocardioides sp. OK12]GHJ60366.1 hypothetical protein NOK12_28840 [Nocardioides sp. OK12]
MHDVTRTGHRPLGASGLAAGLLAASLALVPSTAHAADGPTDLPEAGTAWFGAELDWDGDSPSRYTDRLGTDVSLLARPVAYPLTEGSRAALGDLARTSAEQGAMSVVDLQPAAALDDLDTEDAEELVEELDELGAEHGSRFLLRFAPEMNGTWTPWGQQPTAYVAAFRQLADVVHDEADAAWTVWAPAYGAGYPFGGAINGVRRGSTVTSAATARDAERLDSNGDGELGTGDDPYGPYYPGDAAVDWVGLSMLRYGVDQRFGANLEPTADELQSRLDEEFGYASPTGRRSFYARFADGRDQPMMLSTGALFNPAGTGASERDVKRAWLQRVANAVRFRPRLRAVVWLEDARYEPEVGGQVRWGLTPTRELAAANGRILERGPFDLGPAVTPPEDDDRPAARDGSGADDASEDAADDEAGRSLLERAEETTGVPVEGAASLLGAVALLLGVGLALRARRRRMRPPWL